MRVRSVLASRLSSRTNGRSFDFPLALRAVNVARRVHPQNARLWNDRWWQIVLQNSKNGLQRFFREKSSQATIADRCVLKRSTEVVGEFIVSCYGPPHDYGSPSPQPGKLVFSDPKTVLQHYPPESGHSCVRF